MEQFLHLENCAENNIDTDLTNIDPSHLFELGIEYLNLKMFTKALEEYEITSNDTKYVKKRLIFEINEDKPRYNLICSFLNKVISPSSNFDSSDEFLPILTNVFNLRDSVFGNLVLKLSKENMAENLNKIVDVGIYCGYKKSLKIIFRRFNIKKDIDVLIEQMDKYKNDDYVLSSQKILRKKNKMEKFPEISTYAKHALNNQTLNAYYIGAALFM